MPERFTATIRAEAVPRELADALAMHPIRGSRYRVTVEEVEESDDEKRAALRTAIQKGRDEIAAGHFTDGETAFAGMAAKHFPGRAE